MSHIVQVFGYRLDNALRALCKPVTVDVSLRVVGEEELAVIAGATDEQDLADMMQVKPLYDSIPTAAQLRCSCISTSFSILISTVKCCVACASKGNDCMCQRNDSSHFQKVYGEIGSSCTTVGKLFESHRCANDVTVRYLKEGQSVFFGAKQISIAVDAARIAKRNRFSMVLAKPSGEAMLAPPQVMPNSLPWHVDTSVGRWLLETCLIKWSGGSEQMYWEYIVYSI